MKISSLSDHNVKIKVVPGLSHFIVDNEFLFIKHENKLFKLSARSDLEKLSKIFRILQEPRKLSEIIHLLSNFRKKDVFEFLERLYKLNLIKIESTINQWNVISGFIPNKTRPTGNPVNDVSNRQLFHAKILLIGEGCLANRLFVYMRNMGLNCKRITPSALIDTRFKEKSTLIHDENSCDSIQAPVYSPSFLSSLNEQQLVIVAEDYSNISLFETVNRICIKKKKSWLRVSFDDNIGYLGPFVVPGKSSCYNCCELRLATNSPHYEYLLWKYKKHIPKTRLSILEIFADILSAMCANEVITYLKHSKPETIDNLYVFDTQHMCLSKHKLNSHPNCIFCTSSPIRIQSQSKLLPRISLNADGITSKKSSAIFDSNFLSLDKELLLRLRELIDERTGIVLKLEKLYETNHLGINFHHYFMATFSKPLRIGFMGQAIPLESNNALIAHTGSGYSSSLIEAEIRALMESVERYSNMVIARSRLIWSTFNDVENKGINPSDLGLYTDEQYDRKDSKYSRFSPDFNIPWIEGQDLFSGKPILVPADFVYYPAFREKPLVSETSNGSASHTDVVQAILNGLFEIIERDAFLIMWLNKLSMPILDIKNFPFDFSESIRRINEYGMKVKLVDLTSDTGVTTVLAACYNKMPDKYPALVVGSGCHIEPEKAIQKALFEMEFGLMEFVENPIQKKIIDPKKISAIHEHPVFYLNPKMRKYWNFMISSKKRSTLPKLTKRSFKDNYSLLMWMVKLLHNMNHRVVWVDITPSDILRAGLRVVKVFVPGFQPIFFGNDIRLSLKRLHTVPVRLGYKSIMDESELNTIPHPLA